MYVMGIKVVKFGGSSLASAEQFQKVKNIICAEADRRYVVPSAPGKRFKEDTKVTDMLYTCYNETLKNGEISPVFQQIKERYNQIIEGLGPYLLLQGSFLQ